MSIKVIIADDHKILRQGIIQLLELDKNLRIVGQARDGVECVELVQQVEADVLLLDINMPKMNGIDVLKQIRKNKIPIKVLILTVYDDVEYLMKANSLNVNGYLLKDSDFDELCLAIYSVFNNNKYIQPSLVNKLNNQLIRNEIDQSRSLKISKRELEVLEYICSGFNNKEISVVLNISERTAKNHVASIFKKLDVSDRTQAAIFAIKNNLVKI